MLKSRSRKSPTAFSSLARNRLERTRTLPASTYINAASIGFWRLRNWSLAHFSTSSLSFSSLSSHRAGCKLSSDCACPAALSWSISASCWSLCFARHSTVLSTIALRSHTSAPCLIPTGDATPFPFDPRTALTGWWISLSRPYSMRARVTRNTILPQRSSDAPAPDRSSTNATAYASNITTASRLNPVSVTPASRLSSCSLCL
mmetsp:Transcript_60189/g.142053  ORF Transcript_60189/g.142053 Transcript_60189/m.142053 type:complete len:203 (+) Transcript_60189:3053-3661(+)